MIAQELEDSLRSAFAGARRARQELVTVEHLLLALLDNPSAAHALRACACDTEELRKSLQDRITDETPLRPPHPPSDLQPAHGLQRVIERAILRAQRTCGGMKQATGADALLAILGEKDSPAFGCLALQGVTLEIAESVPELQAQGVPVEIPKSP